VIISADGSRHTRRVRLRTLNAIPSLGRHLPSSPGLFYINSRCCGIHVGGFINRRSVNTVGIENRRYPSRNLPVDNIAQVFPAASSAGYSPRNVSPGDASASIRLLPYAKCSHNCFGPSPPGCSKKSTHSFRCSDRFGTRFTWPSHDARGARLAAKIRSCNRCRIDLDCRYEDLSRDGPSNILSLARRGLGASHNSLCCDSPAAFSPANPVSAGTRLNSKDAPRRSRIILCIIWRRPC